ncbi:hypothetical protein [Escherichia albertii]|uniref:hypothetical protein n=1 Tax=Escherichia albertii TaxID=208962 RepID=UPI0023621131|nr:hypothetical protein [Escherichia albertii]WDC33926.1 hypothetical protein PS048_20090 [Escherichia albertii]
MLTINNCPPTSFPTEQGNVIKNLMEMKCQIEEAARKYSFCDAKIQEVISVIKRNNVLWMACKDKLEVRVIKSLNGNLSLYPIDEENERWSGQYHVYLTIKDDSGKRLVIDPYIGGPASCAITSEEIWIDYHWKGDKERDFTLETIAPQSERYNSQGDYEPPFELEDFMYNSFLPEIYESHVYYFK